LLFQTVPEEDCIELGEIEERSADHNMKPSSVEESEGPSLYCENGDDDDPEKEIDIDIACEERQVGNISV
jgi:hypothetical protein